MRRSTSTRSSCRSSISVRFWSRSITAASAASRSTRSPAGAVTTGLGIVFNNAKLLPGQSIAVFGVGGVGLNVVQGADLVSAYPIVAIDRNEAKLEFACRFGATHTINAEKIDVVEALKDLS